MSSIQESPSNNNVNVNWSKTPVDTFLCQSLIIAETTITSLPTQHFDLTTHNIIHCFHIRYIPTLETQHDMTTFNWLQLLFCGDHRTQQVRHQSKSMKTTGAKISDLEGANLVAGARFSPHIQAFPVATSCIWDNLPQYVTSAPPLHVFRSHHKTHLFTVSYPSPSLCTGMCSDTCHFGHFNHSCFVTYLFTYFVALLQNAL